MAQATHDGPVPAEPLEAVTQVLTVIALITLLKLGLLDRAAGRAADLPPGAPGPTRSLSAWG